LLAQPDVQAVTAILTLSVSASLTLWVAYQRWPRLWPLALPPGFGFTLPARPQYFVLAVVVGLAAPMLGGLLTHLLAHDHDVSQNIQQLGRSASPALRIPLVLVVTSLGPLVEELLFRGVLLSSLMHLAWIPRWRVRWAVVISSLVFALVHLPGLHWQWYAVPQLMLLALVLAWLRLRSGSIWPGAVAHGTYNLLAVAAWLVATHLPG
jgi:membrane protease YdiL (CAAX protease family)